MSDQESDIPQAPIHAPPEAGRAALTKIGGVRFRQDAAVSAYIKVYWVGDSGKIHSKDLGPWKPIGTEEQFVLTDEGIPKGTKVKFSSYVSGVGEYTNGTWYEHDATVRVGAEFRQTGTAIKGWFTFRNLYNY